MSLNPQKNKWLISCVALCLGIVSIGVIVWPWIPQLTWMIENNTEILDVANNNEEENQTLKKQQAEFDISSGNYVLIPKIDVESPIYEGDTDDTLMKGVWRIPVGSTPEHGSNTILTAHRFQYTFGPQTFYHLDKLKKGDIIYVYWQGTEYTYEVAQTFGVSDESVEIENPTDKPILTLYTCELLDQSKRIGIQANLKSTLQVAQFIQK